MGPHFYKIFKGKKAKQNGLKKKVLKKRKKNVVKKKEVKKKVKKKDKKCPAFPLKLHKISCRGPQICSIRDICLPFSRKMENFVSFGVNETSFLQDIQRKKAKNRW